MSHKCVVQVTPNVYSLYDPFQYVAFTSSDKNRSTVTWNVLYCHVSRSGMGICYNS